MDFIACSTESMSIGKFLSVLLPRNPQGAHVNRSRWIPKSSVAALQERNSELGKLESYIAVSEIDIGFLSGERHFIFQDCLLYQHP